MSEKKPRLASREFNPQVFKENLRIVRENLQGIRQAFGEVFFPRLAKRPRLLQRFREEEPQEVIVVEKEAPRDYTKASEYETSRRVYEDLVRTPSDVYRDRLKRGYVKEQFLEPEEVEEETQRPQFKGLGIRDFLRTVFEQSSELIRLRTELEKLRLEKERKQLEEEEKQRKKVSGHSGHLY